MYSSNTTNPLYLNELFSNILPIELLNNINLIKLIFIRLNSYYAYIMVPVQKNGDICTRGMLTLCSKRRFCSNCSKPTFQNIAILV